jgi:hypothetical protein
MKYLKACFFKNPESIEKPSINKFIFKYKDRTFNLTLSKQGDMLIPELSEEQKVRKIKLSDVNTHKLFKDCKTVEDIEEKFKQYITNGKITIVEDHSQYHIVLCEEPVAKVSPGSVYKEKVIIKEILTAQNFIKNKLEKLHGLLQESLNNNNYNKIEGDVNYLEIKLKQFAAEEVNIKESISKVENLIVSNLRSECRNTKITDILIKGIREKFKSFKQSTEIKTNFTKINTMLQLPNELIATGSQQGIQLLDINKKKVKLVKHNNEINNLILLTNGDIVSISENVDYLNKSMTAVDRWKLKDGKFSIDYIPVYKTEKRIKCLTSLKQGKFATGLFQLIILFDFSGDLMAYEGIKSFKAHNGDVLCIARLQESYFVSGSSDGTIKLWDYTGRCDVIIKNFGVVFPLLVLSDGKLVVGKDRKTIKIWEPSEIGRYYCLKEITDFQSNVTALSSPSCYFIISGHENGSIKIWDITCDYTCINVLMGHSSPVTSIVAFNGGHVVSSGSDIMLWE